MVRVLNFEYRITQMFMNTLWAMGKNDWKKISFDLGISLCFCTLRSLYSSDNSQFYPKYSHFYFSFIHLQAFFNYFRLKICEKFVGCSSHCYSYNLQCAEVLFSNLNSKWTVTYLVYLTENDAWPCWPDSVQTLSFEASWRAPMVGLQEKGCHYGVN